MNRCISCGAVIPEGRMVCPKCESTPPTAVVTPMFKPKVKNKKNSQKRIPIFKKGKPEARA